MGDSEEAFNFYRSVFGTEFNGPVIRFSDTPADPNMAPLSQSELNGIMHLELPILGGHVLMASDMLESMGHQLVVGNNTTIGLELDSRDEADRLFAALSAGSSDAMGMQDMPWGAYWGVCLDRFGVRWMFSFTDSNQ
jgi:PhnB protein